MRMKKERIFFEEEDDGGEGGGVGFDVVLLSAFVEVSSPFHFLNSLYISSTMALIDMNESTN